MAQETEAKDSPEKGDRIRLIIRIASVAALAVSLGMYVKDRLAPAQSSNALAPVLLKPLAVSPGFQSAPTLPAGFGALTGQNLIIATLDTTRADHLGFYGHEGIDTPIFDRIAGKGIVFTQAVAMGPTTLPSHASILTGLYPLHHGARTNSHFNVGEQHQTLAEVLSKNGY
jgi:hypothetical protein